ncbi:MAG: hypothetical protein ACK44W_13470 [Planctomycetota bacterium]
MATESTLRTTAHPRATPNRQAEPLASMKYGVALGWMFLFGEKDRIPYAVPERPSGKSFFFRTSTEAARERLAAAIRTLKGAGGYLWSRFSGLEELARELSRRTAPWVELDLEEVLAMGDPGDEFEQQVTAAPARLAEILEAALRGEQARAVELVNSLREISGMELSGDPEQDAESWRRELRFLRLETPEELCRWWVRGALAAARP